MADDLPVGLLHSDPLLASRGLFLASRQDPHPSSPITTGEAMTATGETTTYKAWTEWADDAIGQLDGLHNELDTWCVQIAADDGDQSQLEAIRRWQSDIEAIATEGRQMVASVATTQVPVGEAVAAAGGSDNTPHKEYADEARPR